MRRKTLGRVSGLAKIAGIVGGMAFCAGWIVDPKAQTTLVVTFVCGLSAALSQLGTRDLLSKAQALVDRGADESTSDGGQLYSDATKLRSRIEQLVLGPVISGVLAPAFATIRTLFDARLWTAFAFSAAATAVLLATLLYRANKELTNLLDKDRLEKAQKKRVAELGAQIKPFDAKKASADPNLMGYGMAGHAVPVDRPTVQS